MNSDIKDKQYLALELTRIAYPPTLETSGAKLEEIYTAYEYFLKQTTGITDDIETVVALKNEISKLQRENERLKLINQDNLTPFANEIMSILVGAKGDMEPYVYDSIVNIIKAKIQ